MVTILYSSIYFFVIIGILCFTKIKSKSIKVLVAFYIFDFFVEEIVPNYFYNDVNYYFKIYSFIKPVECIVAKYCFINPKWAINQYLNLVLTIFFITSIYFLFIGKIDAQIINYYSQFEYMIIVILILIYYNNLLNFDNEFDLSNSPVFIYSIGLFFFSICNIIFSGFKIKIYEYNEVIGNNLNEFINIGLMTLRYFFLIYAIILSSFFRINTNE